MCRDEPHRSAQQGPPRLHPVPRRSARGMRQRNAVRRVPAISDRENLSDAFHEQSLADKLRDRELPHRHHQLRSEQLEFPAQPIGAPGDLAGCRHPVASLRTLARETAANRRKVNPIANLLFRPTRSTGEPFEKRLPRRPGKRPAGLGLFVARRLPDEQHPAPHCAAHDTWPLHPRTADTRPQGSEMGFNGGDRGHKKGADPTSAPKPVLVK